MQAFLKLLDFSKGSLYRGKNIARLLAKLLESIEPFKQTIKL